MISNLKLSKSFDTLIEIDDELLLCKQSDIYNGVFGNDLCDYDILIKNDNGLLMQPNEQVNYSVAYFDDLYERVQQGDENDDTIYIWIVILILTKSLFVSCRRFRQTSSGHLLTLNMVSIQTRYV